MNQQNETPELQPEQTWKEPKRVSLSVSVFIALLLCVAVFVSTFTVMKVRLDRVIDEQKEASAKYSKLELLMSSIASDYVREYDEEQLWEGIYYGLFAAVDDPYTEYMSAEVFAQYTADHSGNYVGVGMNVVYDADSETIYVFRVSPSSPAEKAGIRAGDRILRVGTVDVSLSTYQQACEAVSGEKGTSVSMTVKRDEETFTVSVTRDTVETQNVLYEALETENGPVALITIISFSDQTATKQFTSAIERAEKDNCIGLLFDVRNNPGGSLDVICDILDLLLPKGTIVNIVASDGTTETRSSTDKQMITSPMAVLCNGSTASAAELFTADLRDYKLATIVGETTYGKGTMQNITPLGDGSAIKLTTHYYNPASNVSYDQIGIAPDIEVVLDAWQQSHYYMLSHEEDPQLQAALALFTAN